MNFYNTTTNKNVDLIIIDKKSNNEWTPDLLGNSESLSYNRILDRYEITQDDYLWWSNIINGLDKIDDLIDNVKDLLNDEEFEELELILNSEGNANNYEQHINSITSILNNIIIEHKYD